MARPIKKGLDYFPLDVDMDQDDKIQLIEGEFGLKGFAIVVKLFTKIYDNGFYYPWRDKEKLLFARRVGKKNGSLVNEVVSRSVKWGIFNERLFNQSAILTSKAIQQRYFKAIKRRKNIVVPSDYVLVDINQLPEGVNVDKNLVNVDKNPTKESKGKESSVEPSGSPPDKGLPDSAQYGDEARELAEHLRDRIIEFDPDHKYANNPPSLHGWVKEIERAMRLDGRTYEQLEYMIDYIYTESSSTAQFWQGNIESGKKLRKHFDKIKNQIKNERGKQGPKSDEDLGINPNNKVVSL